METTTKRGRPKDPRVTARDELVRALIEAHGQTFGQGVSRNQIRDQLNLTSSLTWLSLNRLRQRGLVERCMGPTGETVWCLSHAVLAVDPT